MIQFPVVGLLNLPLFRSGSASDQPPDNKPVVVVPQRRLSVAFIFGLCLVLGGVGCAFGPKALERTHGRYYESVRLVNEEELLRNLIHLRYNEFPLALNVSSIAAQYELNGSAEARPF